MDVPKVSRLWLLYAVLFFDSRRHSVNAQAGGVIGGAGILVQRAAFCFNNNLLYRGCNEAFRLNQRGEFKVPPEETDKFCNGPCSAETELVLTCINSVMSDFVFYNRATPRDVRNALRGGCSSSFTRGNFNVGDYAQGLYFGKAGKKLPGLFVGLVVGFVPLIL
ncbi:hypothetical protein ISN44_As07g008520 [Arabidopsis suecica]|uniref:DUF7731 domain-containing protein n=1 Tax=Arabidopsis suecica TaxID=45249 RepID=A0A8T2BSB8_ARASU|nr:hypothetical protein ISN44_As07g008520 [Arabidopsis suecica]